MAFFEIPGLKNHEMAFAALVAAALDAIRNATTTTPLTRKAIASVPDSPGIYAIFKDGTLDYAGESGCLKERVRDLFLTRNHSYRRTLGADEFGDWPGYAPASTKQAFACDIETALTKYYAEHLSILWVPVRFGRKEIEEGFVAAGWQLRNKRGQRGM